MSPAILVINSGSSSLKFSSYSINGNELGLVTRGQIDGMSTTPRLRATDAAGLPLAASAVGPGPIGHLEAFSHVVAWLRQRYAGQYTTVAVGHRVVHGGSKFTGPTLITRDVLSQLQELIPLAPLHQPSNLAAVSAIMQAEPALPQVACFDTAFHHARPKLVQRYALSNDWYERGVRRWGFHGLSYESISARFRHLAPETARGRVIVAHLGSGASLCAMQDGRSVDTTMGFSVLDGLPMGTRCGSLDPGVVLHFLRIGMSPDQIEDLLYNKSGLLGMSGTSNDVRELLASDKPAAAEAIEYFVYRIAREIGALTAALGGLEGLIFTAGIGENSPLIRHAVCQRLGWLEISIDDALNQKNDGRISPAGQSPAVWVVPTDEEHVIAGHTKRAIA